MIWVLNLLSSPLVSVFGVLPAAVAVWWSVLRTVSTHRGLQKSAHEREVTQAMFEAAVKKEKGRLAVLDSGWAVTTVTRVPYVSDPWRPHEEQDQPYCQCPAHQNASARAAEALTSVPLPPGMTAAQAAESMERLVSSLQQAGLQVPPGLPGVKPGPCAHPDAVPVRAAGELVAWLCPDEDCDAQLPAKFREDPGE